MILNRTLRDPIARPRRLSDASRAGGASQPQSNIHQGRHLRGQTQMEGAAKVVGAEAGGEEFEKQTQTRVRLCARDITIRTYVSEVRRNAPGCVGFGKSIEIGLFGQVIGWLNPVTYGVFNVYRIRMNAKCAVVLFAFRVRNHAVIFGLKCSNFLFVFYDHRSKKWSYSNQLGA